MRLFRRYGLLAVAGALLGGLTLLRSGSPAVLSAPAETETRPAIVTPPPSGTVPPAAPRAAPAAPEAGFSPTERLGQILADLDGPLTRPGLVADLLGYLDKAPDRADPALRELTEALKTSEPLSALLHAWLGRHGSRGRAALFEALLFHRQRKEQKLSAAADEARRRLLTGELERLEELRRELELSITRP